MRRFLLAHFRFNAPVAFLQNYFEEFRAKKKTKFVKLLYHLFLKKKINNNNQIQNFRSKTMQHLNFYR